MIAVWMLYCLGIGLALSVAGFALERGLRYAGRPTRWAWVIAIVGAYVVPVAAWLRPEAFATFAAPIPVVFESGPGLPTSTTSTTIDQPPPSAFSLADLDAPLRWGWGLVSFALVLTMATAALRLLAMRRRWRHGAVDGRDVLISSNVGPAVVGLWSPRVVLPEWALDLPAAERDLMLAHEEQHMRARDPAVIAAGFLLVLLAPWNVALWWQWRRLRLAVEIDCDRRVLAQGRSAPAYGELLIRVGERRSPRLLSVAAFGEPASFLEARIRRMVSATPRWRWLGAVAAVVAATAAFVVACETPRPLAPVESSAIPSANGLRARELSDSLSVRWQSDRLRPAIERYARSSTARMILPSFLAPSGPPMTVYLIGDASLRVYRISSETLYYLRNARPTSEIDAADLKSAAPFVDPGHDGWLVVDPRALRGLVRDNVRVIWIHHDPAPQDTVVPALIQQSLRDQTPEHERRVELVRRLARQFHPEMFAQRGSQIAIALVLDPRENILAHAASAGEARGSDGIYASGESCLDVLNRLIPQYKTAQWSQSGCAGDPQRNVIIYWGQLLKP